MHIITIVDFWRDLKLAQEKKVKKDIIDFLDQQPEMMIVNACYDLTPRPNKPIRHCDPMLVDYIGANPHRHLDVDINDIEWTFKVPWQTYTICGFHAGWWHCVMERPIALYQMMLNHPDRHQDITVRWDLSCTDKGEYYKLSKRRLVRRMGFSPKSPLNVVFKSR